MTLKWNHWLPALLACGLFIGCSGDDTDDSTDGDAGTEQNQGDETPGGDGSETPGSGNGDETSNTGDEDPAAPEFYVLKEVEYPGIDDSDPTSAAKRLKLAVEKRDAVVMYQALPMSYRKDIDTVMQAFGTKMDAELWDGVMDTLAKTHEVLKTKKEFVLKNPMLGQGVAAGGGDPENPGATYDDYVKILTMILDSQLRTRKQVTQFSGGKFAEQTATPMFQHLASLEVAKDQVEDARRMSDAKIELKSREGDKAVVTITTTEPDKGGEQAEIVEEEEFTLVEGKWIPSDVAEDWDPQVALDQIAEMDVSQAKPMVMQTKGQLDSALDAMLKAETQEAFDQEVTKIGASFGPLIAPMLQNMFPSGSSKDFDTDPDEGPEFGPPVESIDGEGEGTSTAPPE